MRTTIKVSPVNFGLGPGGGISGDEVAGLLSCTLWTPARHHRDDYLNLGDDNDDLGDDNLIEENMVPSSVESEHLVHRQEKYLVSADVLLILTLL